MTQGRALGAAELASFTAWTHEHAAVMGARLAETVGAEVSATTAGEAVLTDEAAIREGLPSAGAGCVFAITRGEESWQAFVFLPHEASLGLAFLKAGDGADGLEERLGGDAALSDDEKAALVEVAGIATAPLVEGIRVLASDDVTVEARDVALLQDSSWDGDSDPLIPGDYVRVDMTITLAARTVEGVRLLLPCGVLTAAPGLSIPVARDPETFAALVTSDIVKASLERSLDAEKLSCHGDMEAFTKAIAESDIDAGVVEIGEGEEPLLEQIKELRDHADVLGKPFVIVLDRPTVLNVVNCGVLGFTSVLPAEFSREHFESRLRR